MSKRGYKQKIEHIQKRINKVLGRKNTEETKEKIRKSVSRVMNEPKMRERIKEARFNQIYLVKDTSIEIKIQNFLKELEIEFFTHQKINIEHRYQCDVFIPSMNLVIECDGDYWHKFPLGRDIDKVRTFELLEKGFKVLRLWEREIRVMDLNNFRNKLNQGGF